MNQPGNALHPAAGPGRRVASRSEQPLRGLTVLIVAAPHPACDTLQSLFRQSGARARRAHTRLAAWRHLQTYRPGMLIVDLGLPHDPGDDLLRDLARASQGDPAILALSDLAEHEQRARAAGADGFLLRPIEGPAALQRAVLAALSVALPSRGPRPLPCSAALHDGPVDLAGPPSLPRDPVPRDASAVLTLRHGRQSAAPEPLPPFSRPVRDLLAAGPR